MCVCVLVVGGGGGWLSGRAPDLCGVCRNIELPYQNIKLYIKTVAGILHVTSNKMEAVM